MNTPLQLIGAWCAATTVWYLLLRAVMQVTQ
jgi:hypothetical protein